MADRPPEAFMQRMRALLQDEYDAFAASYDQSRLQGLRVNTLKWTPGEFEQAAPFELKPVPWVKEGYYYGEADRPGKHPYYHAGLYYIQEPSAMAPVEALDVRPGDRVLDLCAAPGGKSTQIAAKLRHAGVLVSNDFQAERVKALAKNLELFGVRNAVILNETPERLSRVFPQYFDKILVDAPCSGEGMFRKDEDMGKHWQPDAPQQYASLQWQILTEAVKMLAPGGRMVYSTCTFSPEENEMMMVRLLKHEESLNLIEPFGHEAFSPGRPDWLQESDGTPVTERIRSAVGRTRRLWPHRLDGEGHFVAVLQRDSDGQAEDIASLNARSTLAPEKYSQPPYEECRTFFRQHLTTLFPGKWVDYGRNLYLSPEGVPDLGGLKVTRPGWFIGTVKKNRFEPSQSLALGIHSNHVVRRIEWKADSEQVVRYLKGETLQVEETDIICAKGTLPPGLCLICVHDLPLGWGKWNNGTLKNQYPPGWRWR